MTKRCRSCEQHLDVAMFGPHKRSADRLNYYCRPCATRISRENRRKMGKDRPGWAEWRAVTHRLWVEKNREKMRRYERDRQLKTYGLTFDDYTRLFVSQHGLCAICSQKQTRPRRLMCVDHCHDTGAVRGLLCDSCNRALGLLRDSRFFMEKAIDYLNNPPAGDVL